MSSTVISRELLFERFPYLFGFMKEAIFQRRPSLQKMQTNGFWSKQEIEEGSDL